LSTLEDGVPYRDVLEGLLDRPTLKPQRRAEIEAELETPPFPLELEHVWTAFCRLNARRRSGFSIEPIGWADLDAFIRLTGARLAPFEIQLIEMLDDVFRRRRA
jgi:hypothetical protein